MAASVRFCRRFLAWQDKGILNESQPRRLSGHEARRHQLRDLCALRQPARAARSGRRRPGYHPRACHPRGGGRRNLCRGLDGRAAACAAHAKLGPGKQHQCPGVAGHALRHSSAHDHQPPGRQWASRLSVRCPWAGSRFPCWTPWPSLISRPCPAEAEETVARPGACAGAGRRPVAVLLDLEFWRGK